VKYLLSSATLMLTMAFMLPLAAIAAPLTNMSITSGPPRTLKTSESPQPNYPSDSSTPNSTKPSNCLSTDAVKQLKIDRCSKPTAKQPSNRVQDDSYPGYCPALPPRVTSGDWLYKQTLQRCLYGS
jgi:hypothetical protein